MSILYDEYLDQHRGNVLKAYDWLKENLPEIISEDVIYGTDLEYLVAYAHDASKNSFEEYFAYDDYFYGEIRTPEVIENFRYAWLHHIHNNPHHWQHWILRNDDQDEGEIVLKMPIKYAIEMICDWWAFSFAKGDLAEIFNWYDERKGYIKLHPETRKFVENVLAQIKTKLERDDIYE